MPKGQGLSGWTAQVFPDKGATRARRGTEQEPEWRVTAYRFLGPASSSESGKDAEQKHSQLSRVLEPGLEGLDHPPSTG